jgi:transposase
MGCDDQQSRQREVLQACVAEGGDGCCLLDLLSRSRARAEERYGVRVKAIVIQEAGSDGFWIHRLLLANGSRASIAVDRRHRRAKTDSIEGETLLRTLMAWARGERRVCTMVRVPSPEDEDRRRLTREPGTLIKERIQHTRIRGLLSGQGSRDYNPLRRIVSNGSRRARWCPATSLGLRFGDMRVC